MKYVLKDCATEALVLPEYKLTRLKLAWVYLHTPQSDHPIDAQMQVYSSYRL